MSDPLSSYCVGIFQADDSVSRRYGSQGKLTFVLGLMAGYVTQDDQRTRWTAAEAIVTAQLELAGLAADRVDGLVVRAAVAASRSSPLKLICAAFLLSLVACMHAHDVSHPSAAEAKRRENCSQCMFPVSGLVHARCCALLCRCHQHGIKHVPRSMSCLPCQQVRLSLSRLACQAAGEHCCVQAECSSIVKTAGWSESAQQASPPVSKSRTQTLGGQHSDS